MTEIKNKGTINELFDEAYSFFESQGKLVSGPETSQKNLLRYSDLKDFLINKKGLSAELTDKVIQILKMEFLHLHFQMHLTQ